MIIFAIRIKHFTFPRFSHLAFALDQIFIAANCYCIRRESCGIMSGRRSKSIRLQEYLLRIFLPTETINRSVVLACCAMQLLWHFKLFCRRKQNQSSYFSTCERHTKIWTANKLLSIPFNHVRSTEEIPMKLSVDENILKFATAIKRFAEPDFEGSCLISCLSSFITTEPRITRFLRIRSRWHQSKSCNEQESSDLLS